MKIKIVQSLKHNISNFCTFIVYVSYLQTFRQYREVFEQQKAVLEQRYRGLLEDAIQDAIFLSTRNNELLMENQSLQHREY